MALIHCPECDKEISDKVKACPHCGYPLTEERDKPSLVEQIAAKIKGKKSRTVFIIAGTIILLTVAAFIGIHSIQKKQAQEAYNTYVDNLSLAQILMLDGGSKAETLCNLTSRVWYNAIHEERDIDTNEYTRPDGEWVSDFNEALTNLYSDADILMTIVEIESNNDNVRYVMKDLQDPPEEFERCYETVSELYTAYQGITGLAVNPTGSYNSFTESKREKVNDFLETHEELNTQMPEKITINNGYGGSKPERTSDEMYGFGVAALEIADAYLDGEIDIDEAENRLDTIYFQADLHYDNELSEADEDTLVGTENDNDISIKHKVLMLNHEMSMNKWGDNTTSDIVEARNGLAEVLDIKPRKDGQ